MTRYCSVALLGAVALAAGLARSASSASAPSDPAAVPRISQEDFKKGLESKALVAVDTRAQPAYAAGHVPGALLWNSDPAQLDTQLAQLKASGKQIVTYCT